MSPPARSSGIPGMMGTTTPIAPATSSANPNASRSSPIEILPNMRLRNAVKVITYCWARRQKVTNNFDHLGMSELLNKSAHAKFAKSRPLIRRWVSMESYDHQRAHFGASNVCQKVDRVSVGEVVIQHHQVKFFLAKNR